MRGEKKGKDSIQRINAFETNSWQLEVSFNILNKFLYVFCFFISILLNKKTSIEESTRLNLKKKNTLERTFNVLYSNQA